MNTIPYLDLSPIHQPKTLPHPEGETINFDSVVQIAGMKNITSSSSAPQIRIHERSYDFKAVAPGAVIYCISSHHLPNGDKERAVEILRRLAYGFHDWAAREIVARYHRDLKRRLSTLNSKPDVMNTQAMF